jgi:uncharacterized protein (TIGR02001 family)
VTTGSAGAQVAGSVGIQNTYRLRGYSISDGHPVATLDLSYDHSSGVYVDLSALAEFEDDASPEFLGYIANVGYAHRIGPQLSVDGGVVRTQFSHYAVGQSSDAHYTDLYVGIAGRGLSAHLHYSPDYYRSGIATLYGEVDGAVKPAEKWQLTGHVGALGYLSYPGNPAYYRYYRATHYDWRAGVARELGRISLHADLSGGGPNPIQTSRTGWHQGTALTVGARWVF